MVTSSPLSKTRAAASGSIQMLNSADGVWLPSWMAPPMSTTRSIFAAASGCASRSRATFVSGPSATSVTGRSEAAELLRQEVLRVLGDGLGARRRKVDAVEPGLSVRVRRDDELAGEGAVRAGGDADVRSARELEHAERVRRRLVERLVPRDRRHAEDVELRAPQGEKERERIVLARVAVDEDRDHARCVRAGRRSRR